MRFYLGPVAVSQQFDTSDEWKLFLLSLAGVHHSDDHAYEDENAPELTDQRYRCKQTEQIEHESLIKVEFCSLSVACEVSDQETYPCEICKYAGRFRGNGR